MPLDATLRLLLLSALWGASFLFIRIAAPQLGAFSTAFFRVLLGTLGLLAMLVILRNRWDFRGNAKATLLIGVVNSGIPFAMFGIAAHYLPAGYLAMLNATTPLLGVVIGALFFHEAMTRNRLFGVLLGLAGVAVLMQAGPVTMDHRLLLGASACLVAAGCYGLAGFLVRRWITQRGGMDALCLAVGTQMGATLSLAPLMAMEAKQLSPWNAWSDPNLWWAMLALGLACTSLAYLLYFRLLQDLGPVKPLTVTMLVPAFGVLWGALFLGERVTLAHLAGGLLIAGALWLILFKAPVSADVARQPNGTARDPHQPR